MTLVQRVREYAALIRKAGPDSRTARTYRNDNAFDLAFLAYASAMVRSWRQNESCKKLQENRRIWS